MHAVVSYACAVQEYAGIDAERLERMEARLKADVLAEAGEAERAAAGAGDLSSIINKSCMCRTTYA